MTFYEDTLTRDDMLAVAIGGKRLTLFPRLWIGGSKVFHGISSIFVSFFIILSFLMDWWWLIKPVRKTSQLERSSVKA